MSCIYFILITRRKDDVVDERTSAMQWSELYGNDQQPTEQDISKFIANDLWDDLQSYLQEAYKR